MPKYKQYSPILACNFEQKGQENTTSYNHPYWPCYHGRNVRVNHNIHHEKSSYVSNKGKFIMKSDTHTGIICICKLL